MKKSFLASTVLEYLLILIICGLLVGFTFAPINPMDSYPSRDSSLFLYAGQQLLTGGDLYLDIWDNKGPLIFFINALGLWIASDTRWGVWLLESTSLVAAALCGYYGLKHIWGHPSSLFATILWLIGLGHIHGGGNFTEGYSLIFNFLALTIFLIRSPVFENKLSFFIIGLSLAGSFFLRANNIGLQLSILFSFFLIQLLNRGYGKIFFGMLWTLLGFLVPSIIVIGYFWVRGNLMQMIEASLIYNFYYSDINNSFRFSVWDGIAQIGFPAYLALVGYLLVFVRAWNSIKLGENATLWIFLLLGWPIDALLSSLSGRNYPHYYISWMPVLSTLLAFLFAEFSRFAFSDKFLGLIHRPSFLTRWVLFGLVFFYFNGGTIFVYRDIFVRLFFEREKGIEAIDPVSRYIRRETKEEDQILIWGLYHRFYYLSRRDAPTPYVVYPVYKPSPYIENMSMQFFEDVSQAQPRLIVDASSKTDDYILSLDPEIRQQQLNSGNPTLYIHTPYQEEFFTYFETNYRLVETIDGFNIYLLIEKAITPLHGGVE